MALPMCWPVRRSWSRRKYTSSTRGSTVALRTLPLTVIETCDMSCPRGAKRAIAYLKNCRLELPSRMNRGRGELLNHAEEVAVRVFQHHEIGAWPISPWITRRSELDEPLHLCALIIGVEIEVQAISSRSLLSDAVQGQFGRSTVRFSMTDPAVPPQFSR